MPPIGDLPPRINAPALSPSAQLLRQEMKHLLADTGDRYVSHLRTTLQLMLEDFRIDHPLSPSPPPKTIVTGERDHKILAFHPRRRRRT